MRIYGDKRIADTTLTIGDWSNDEAMRVVCRPLQIDVYTIASHVKEDVLRGWESRHVSDYKGCHGMTIPSGEAEKKR